MRIMEGMQITAYGQQVRIANIVNEQNKDRFYLRHPIVVPGKEYTRDYVSKEEIQEVNEAEYYGIE